MLKKSLSVIAFASCISLLNATDAQTSEPKQTVLNKDSAKYEIRNLAKHQTIARALDELLTTIKAYVDSHEVQNAQQMYELVTRVRQNEHNMFVFECYNVIRSFLRDQSLRISTKELTRDTEKLIKALSWFVTANVNEYSKAKSFYTPSSNYLQHTYMLTRPDIFIHLTQKQQQDCIKIAKQISTVSNIHALGDDPLAEDGMIQTTESFSQNLKTCEAIIEAVQKIEDAVNELNNDSLPNDQLQLNIRKLTSILNSLKTDTLKIVVDGKEKEMPVSKNLRRELRLIGGNVMTNLQNKFTSK